MITSYQSKAVILSAYKGFKYVTDWWDICDLRFMKRKILEDYNPKVIWKKGRHNPYAIEKCRGCFPFSLKRKPSFPEPNSKADE